MQRSREKEQKQQHINQHNAHVLALYNLHRTQARAVPEAFLNQCLARHSWISSLWTIPSTQSLGGKDISDLLATSPAQTSSRSTCSLPFHG
ncbi:hypothetical protein TNCT_32541 [Trichonephila clavata]|uniref:Uncharacterized protein n=1 Tax=Trichonephila clavata TaxID=2740835 RepID=A0A8X6JF40_TRICU|nr:hypothetical protein TNCT_32541 [Trichonephila clavata]